MKLSAFAVLLAMSCVSAHSSAPKTPWSIELTTAGGIAGHGHGNISISSEGSVALQTIDGKRCTFDATPDERERLTTLLGQADPDAWKATYAPEDYCCDRIEYALKVDEAGVVRETAWIDDPLPMPDDLQALVQALGDLRRTYGEQCP